MYGRALEELTDDELRYCRRFTALRRLQREAEEQAVEEAKQEAKRRGNSR